MNKKNVIIASVSFLAVGLAVLGYTYREYLNDKLSDLADKFKHEPEVEAD